MACLLCKYSGVFAQELVWGYRQIYIDIQLISVMFKVRGSGSPAKPLSIVNKLGICIDIWPSCIASTAACWQKTIIHRYTIDLYKKAAIFEVRSSASPTRPH